jgi:DNA-binding CsgD family transcriptional regulator
MLTFTGGRARGGNLTERELQILALVAGGLSTPEIAERLGIAPATVKTHLTSTYRKVGAKNRVQAARYYLDYLRDRDAV